MEKNIRVTTKVAQAWFVRVVSIQAITKAELAKFPVAENIVATMKVGQVKCAQGVNTPVTTKAEPVR